ncbi:MAG: DUF6364 family protein [Spirochaetales bacterium]
MANVTMSIDDDLLKKARKIAIDNDTTLSEMYREYLAELTLQEDARRAHLADELDGLFAQSRASSGGILTSRNALHER